MNEAEAYAVNGMWQCRLETSQDLVRRVVIFLSLAESARSQASTWWFHRDDSMPINPLEDPDGFATLLEQSVSADDFADHPIWGHSVSAFFAGLDGQDHPRMPHLSLCAGSSFSNWIRIVSSQGGVANLCVPTYDTMRSNVMAVAKAFEPDWCQGGPASLERYTDFELYARPPITLDWMIYLCPSLAAMVTPPDPSWHVTSERFRDGSLFMSATEAVFDTANQAHIDAARAIHRRIDPLNFIVPFNGRSGRNPRA